MTEEYVKIYCDRCGEEALVRKARFPDCIAGCCVSDSGRWSLKDKSIFVMKNGKLSFSIKTKSTLALFIK